MSSMESGRKWASSWRSILLQWFWKVTPEQIRDLGRVAEYLEENPHGSSKEGEVAAMCWALAAVALNLKGTDCLNPNQLIHTTEAAEIYKADWTEMVKCLS